MNKCLTCKAPLYSEVNFCPFCGTEIGVPAQKAATGAPQGATRISDAVPAAIILPPQETGSAVVSPVAESSAQPVTPPVAESPAQPATPPSPEAPPTKGWRAKQVIGGLLVVGVVGVLVYFASRPDGEELACDAAFDLGSKAVAASDLVAARSQALHANAVCRGASRAKADALQTAINSAEKTVNACLRRFHTIDTQIDEHRLNSARDQLNQLTSACLVDPTVAQLRQKLSQAQALAQTAQSELRTALNAKNLTQAQAAFARLSGIHREYPDLAQLKGEMDHLADAVAKAQRAATALVTESTNVREAAPVQPGPIVKDVNTKAEMAWVFLRDAENALSQRKFDVAKTYVDSARRMDPDNPRLDRLYQQIRERERQVLQQETTIK